MSAHEFVEDPITAFRDAMAKEGIKYSGPIDADGKLHRFQVDDDPKGRKNGWYCMHNDQRPAGAFGCNKRWGDKKFSWTMEGLKPLSAEERREVAARAAAAKAKAERDEAERHAQAKKLSEVLWGAAAEVPTHPYLTKKGVQSHGLRKGLWKKPRPDGSLYTVATDALLIPMRDEAKVVWGLQAIFAAPVHIGGEDRGKDFVFGGRKQGLWFSIGKPGVIDDKLTVALCEGYATGASIHEATGLAVLVCFDAGNLVHVAKVARRLMPQARLIICADNDQWTQIRGTPVNVGVEKATEAAKTVDGIVAVPWFLDVNSRPNDFNDLHALSGPEEVARQVFSTFRAVAPLPEPASEPVDPAPAAGSGNLTVVEGGLSGDPAPDEKKKRRKRDEGDGAIGDHNAISQNAWFRVLGHDRDLIYIFQAEMRMVIARKQTDWGRNAFLTLANMAWWQQNFPGGGKDGFDTGMATNALIRHAFERGFYDPTKTRGRGAWRDAGRHIFHFGGKLLVDGVTMEVTDLHSNFVYEQGRHLHMPPEEPLSGADGARIIKTAQAFHWTRPASAILLAGWVALAPLCGALRWRPHIWLTGGAGSGKALPHSAGILTPQGWSAMGEMRIGTTVTTPDGGYGKVIGVYPQGEQPVFKITFADGRTARATGDHLWKVRIKEKWRLRTTDQMIEILGRGSRHSTKLAIQLPEALEIKNADLRPGLPLHPYALGALLGDGCLGENADGSGTVSFTCFDPEIVDHINEVCAPEHLGMFERGAAGAYRFGDLAKYGLKTRQTIKELRLLGPRSHTKFIPDAYLNASVEERRELLRGLMDTDGTICERGAISFCTVSERLRDDVVYLVRSLGGCASVSSKNPTYMHNGERRRGRVAYNVNIRMRDRESIFHLGRKQARAIGPYQYEDCLYLNVKTIEPDGVEECSCIAIDHPDRLYVTDDFVVTHNTTILNEFIWPLMNGLEIYAQGNSTEAGIRQTLMTDALPVLYDESEQNDKVEQFRVQQILALIRQASTESGAKTLKGTQGGEAQGFMIRSMFCLSSVQVGMRHQADVERISVLALRPKREGDPTENWAAIKGAVDDLKDDPNLPGRLLRRAIQLLPVTLQNIETFARVAARKFGSQREGDQYGAMLAGAWSLVKTGLATEEDAYDMIQRYDWSDYTEGAEKEESTKALETLLERLIRTKTGDVSVFELLSRASGRDGEGAWVGSRRDAEDHLRRHGMKIKWAGPDPRMAAFVVANSSSALAELMADTPYASDVKGQLGRVPGAFRCEPEKFNGTTSRGVGIPLLNVLDDLHATVPDPFGDDIRGPSEEIPF